MKNSYNDLINAVCNNERLVKFYAKSGCKDCIGKGYRDLQGPGQDVVRHLCFCVRKRVKKEVNNE